MFCLPLLGETDGVFRVQPALPVGSRKLAEQPNDLGEARAGVGLAARIGLDLSQDRDRQRIFTQPARLLRRLRQVPPAQIDQFLDRAYVSMIRPMPASVWAWPVRSTK